MEITRRKKKKEKGGLYLPNSESVSDNKQSKK